jgi:thiol:disulfide interchange protein DsbA
MAANYQIDGVPTLAVQGKYETSPAQAGGSQAALQVLDYLVSQVRAKRM